MCIRDRGIFLHRDSPLMTGIMLAPELPLEEAFFLFFLSYLTMVLFTGLVQLLRWRAEQAAGPGRRGRDGVAA